MLSKPKFKNQKLKRPQFLYQAVQDEVKAYIIEQALVPGDALPPETELAEQLGVSRNSVREAIKSLETLGIVEARTGAGLFVRNFSFDPLLENLAYGMMFDLKDLADILEVRFHIEHSMIDQAVAAVTDEQLEQFHAILERMRALLGQGKDYDEEDRLFHRALWANVKNRSVGKIVDVFWMVFSQARQRTQEFRHPTLIPCKSINGSRHCGRSGRGTMKLGAGGHRASLWQYPASFERDAHFRRTG